MISALIVGAIIGIVPRRENLCAVAGRNRSARARGGCQMHQGRWCRSGTGRDPGVLGRRAGDVLSIVHTPTWARGGG
jgi:hypothetical protein